MQISKNGVDLIKQFEGLSLKPVKLTGEQYWTVGYGHYGADVNPNKILTQEEAEILLIKDLQSFVLTVNSYFKQYGTFQPNQNQFDAMVSFTYNCGAGCLKQLIQGRKPDQIAEHMLAYTGSASETFRLGLARRRRIERELFITHCDKKDEELDMTKDELMATKGTGDKPSAWAKTATEWAKKEGIFAGDGAGNYGWQQPISREAVAQILYNALGKKK